MGRGNHEDESALIYGLESQARALCSGPSGSSDSLIRFIVATQSLKSDNFVHLLEYVEENHSLSKSIVKHPAGEVWALCSSSKNCQLLATIHSKPTIDHDNQITSGCTLWKIPVDISSSIIDEDVRSDLSPSLEPLCNLTPTSGKTGKGVALKPEDEDHLINFNEDKLFLWDIQSHQLVSELPIDGSRSKLSKITSVRWSPHSGGNVVGTAIGNSVCGIDIRSKPTPEWSISSNNSYVRDLDFNPNAQYYFATCGDDFESKFWDIRKLDSPVVSLLNHSHWIWSIRYNQFHDQLVLTCSSDSRVVLSRISTLASQPFGHLLDEEDEPSSEDDFQPPSKKEETQVATDEVIATFEEHEDSIYAAEWSSSDPWTFASLSVDGRLVINKVPKNEKFKILF